MTNGPAIQSSGHPDRWRALVVCCLGVFLLVVSLSSLNVALAEIAGAFDADISDLQWIVDSYAVAFAGLLLAGGAIGDRIGRRPAFVIGFTLLAGANLLAALGDAVSFLIAMRTVAGLGAAIMMPATLATVSEVFDDETRPRAIAIWSSIAAAGGAFGPFLGGWMLTVSGWQAVFILNGVIALVGLVLVPFWVPLLPGQRLGRFDFLGALLSVAAVGCLVFLVIEGPVHPLSLVTLASAVGAVGFAVAFVRHERSTPYPLLPLELFDNSERSIGAGTLTLAAFGFNGVFFVGALLVQIGWGESGLVAGLLLVPIGVSEVIIANGSVQLAQRFGVEKMITLGLVLMAMGYLGMGFTPDGNRWWFVVAGIIAGMGNGLTIPLSIERIVGDVDPAFAGAAASVNDMAIELGASTGIGLLGALQRVWFEAGVPAGATTIIGDVTTEAERSAFRDASAAAFVLAAAVALLAIPIARLSLRKARAER